MNGGIKMPQWLTQNALYMGIILGILFVLIIVLLVSKKQKRTKVKPKPLNEAYLINILEALGYKENIKALSSEHQRLKVVVDNVKKVDAIKLKALETPAILKGREITLLIKHHTKDVLSYLKKEIGE